MPRIKYVGPIVGVDVVIVGLSDVQPGDEFDASPEAAEQLLVDDSMYLPADEAARVIAATVAEPEPTPEPEPEGDLEPEPATDASTDDADPAQEG